MSTSQNKCRPITLLLIIACLLTAIMPQMLRAEEAHVPKDKLHIYLCIGQSNMAGRAPFTEEDAKPIDRCLLLNGEDQWEPAAIPLNKHSTIRKGIGMQKMNPSYMFAKTMLQADKDITIGLVVNAKGGTRIDQWKKGMEKHKPEEPFYVEAVRRTKIAMQTGTLKGIIWHQGEANRKDPKYIEKISKFIANLREDLGTPDLPFVCGQINMAQDQPINTLILELPKQVPHTGVVSAEGLVAMDAWHFDRKSMVELGSRYGKKMLEVQGKVKSQATH
ncbi:MAG: sialate O-acetylesterase [Phycisphaeraceae bacterium JB051]